MRMTVQTQQLLQDGGAPNTCTTIEQRGVVRFLWAKNMDAAKNIDKEMLPIWAAFLCGYPLLHPYFLSTKTQNSTLFYRGTCIQGRRHLVTSCTPEQSCAYRSLFVTIKLDSAAI
jgi:hypothetical protein